MFQISTFERGDMWRLVYTLYTASGDQTTLEEREQIFDALYPVLEKGLEQIYQEGKTRRIQGRDSDENSDTQRKEDVEGLKEEMVEETGGEEDTGRKTLATLEQLVRLSEENHALLKELMPSFRSNKEAPYV